MHLRSAHPTKKPRLHGGSPRVVGTLKRLPPNSLKKSHCIVMELGHVRIAESYNRYRCFMHAFTTMLQSVDDDDDDDDDLSMVKSGIRLRSPHLSMRSYDGEQKQQAVCSTLFPSMEVRGWVGV
ncbi:hypothetical protein BHE74_00052727 [Ensete ventricosum]|nr:hypothetical protein BHE74_00052727 [Ensete ventricosum]